MNLADVPEVRCAGFYGDARAASEPNCGWRGLRSELTHEGKCCPSCGAGHIVLIIKSENQWRVTGWLREVLGATVAKDGPERVIRFVEEAVEFAQSVRIDADLIHGLVDYVYSRPPGDPGQEIAGSKVTLYAAADALGIDADVEFEKELKRIDTPEIIARVRRRQAEKREVLASTGAQYKRAADRVIERCALEIESAGGDCADYHAGRVRSLLSTWTER